MSAKRGWCPTLHAPMASGDGWLVRVNPRAGRLPAGALRRIAALAAAHGNGAIELTARGRLQLRGLDPAGAAALLQEAVAAGLADPDPLRERLRGCAVSPLAGMDPDCAAETLALALRLEDAVGDAAPTLAGLPDKMFLVVDGGGALPLDGVPATVALRCRDGEWGLETGGRRAVVGVGELVERAIALLRGRASGAASDPECATGLRFEPMPLRTASDPVAVGPLASGAFGLGTPPGTLDAGRLDRLAAIAEKHADPVIRFSPFRSLILVPSAPSAFSSPPGLVVDPADPRLRVAHCVGAPRCASGFADVATDAAFLAPLVPPGGRLHLSGCAKGCAHPGPAPLTLVGTAGGYDLVRDGRAGDPPDRTGLDRSAVAALLGRAA